MKEKLFFELEEWDSEKRMKAKATHNYRLKVTLISGVEIDGTYEGCSRLSNWLKVAGTVINADQIAAYKKN